MTSPQFQAYGKHYGGEHFEDKIRWMKTLREELNSFYLQRTLQKSPREPKKSSSRRSCCCQTTWKQTTKRNKEVWRCKDCILVEFTQASYTDSKSRAKYEDCVIME
eukprot:Blabericola_migrator_1__1358@NODE_1351_length_4742_cov_13_507166_g669_i2_p9_GENE_NODE_1351_length_4742_cov_13_507166_g669_i2NODE_1351_length_4742_cov_13_507166_g669_i2_p9_ORF_typecomplete_len106_score13_18OrfB_Zn_ribbon/PF07282_11/0_038_NODE_1351_length_4742_cov_13_507166_g669_i216952012